MHSTRPRRGLGPIPAWLEIQGLSEESLRVAVTGLGIEILGALCARAEPPTVRVRLCSLAARKFTYTMYAELCQYMESCRVGRGSEGNFVPRCGGKDAEETGGPGGVVRIKVQVPTPCTGEQEKLHANFACNSCYQVFNTKAALMKHGMKHRPASSDKKHKCSDHSYSRCCQSMLMNRTQIHAKERRCSCSVCGKGFSYLCNLKNHMRIHTQPVRSYACKACVKTFSNRSCLKNHMRIHTGERPYACKFCGKTYYSSSSLRNHVYLHTKGPFTCPVCARTFTLSSTLKTHSRIHTGERPYACTVCTKAFSLSSALKAHKIIHTGQSPYTCTVCGKVFSCSSILKRHIGFHIRKNQIRDLGEKPYKCSVCSKVFARSVNLSQHKKIHNGEKPSKSSVCSKALIRSSNLYQHEIIHKGEKPANGDDNQQEKSHKCSVCNKAFAQSSTLRRHQRIHSEDHSTSGSNWKSSPPWMSLPSIDTG